MKKFPFSTLSQTFLADTLTPVVAYLRLRDVFPGAILLESSDYNGASNSFSYLCFDALASFELRRDAVQVCFGDADAQAIALEHPSQALHHLQNFLDAFAPDADGGIAQGVFGYTAFDAVRCFESVDISGSDAGIPDICYKFYRNVLEFDHFHNRAKLYCNVVGGTDNRAQVLEILNQSGFANYGFQTLGARRSNQTDAEFLEKIKIAQQHCQRGDVFQLVLSRRFTQDFQGDEFQVYRSLRSINPSPYLFYFDYGDFKLMGSSPEAHLVVRDGKMEIHPIAGTFKRTGHDKEDAEAAARLARDPKETAEHVMLVDLARNDLSRAGTQVQVDTFCELQFFSHVIHLVSKVTAQLRAQKSTLQALAGTFPAGTLSGAPKHKALQLIESLEPTARGFYGGAIGYMDFKGNFNHAILIRSFLSQDYTLTYQAGAGVTIQSDPESELQEVYHKTAALEQALQRAQNPLAL